MIQLLNDSRHAVRVLLKNRGFSIVAIVTLAMGIGLNVTVFSILNVLLFKPLAVQHASELVWVTGRSTGPERLPLNLTYPDIVDLRRATVAVQGVAAFAESRMALRAGAQAVRVPGQIVTGNYFAMLGVSTAAGRGLVAADDGSSGSHTVAVISEALSNRLFGGPIGAVGQPIEINGHAFTVVGVAPPRFRGVDILVPAEVWVPISAATQVTSIRDPGNRDSWWLKGIARLATGVDRRQAEAVLGGIAAAIAQAYPESHKGFGIALHPVRGATPEDQDKLSALALLPAVPLTVLLIACANVASLLIARGVGRQREIAIRTALGASRGHLIRQFLAESLVLALAGGACSLLISLWTPELLVRIAGAPISADFTPDIRLVLFTFAVSLFTALAFGLVPALRVSRTKADLSLRGEPGAAEGSPRASRLQRVLVAGQLAMSLVLLMAAGLFVESVAHASRTYVGFETAGRVTFSLDLEMQRYSDERAAAFHRVVLDRVSALPGIHGATLAAYIPLGGRVLFMPFYPAGRPVDPGARPQTTAVNMVGPKFFETLRLPVRRGRSITEGDQGQKPRVVVINETMAARLSAGGDPIGQRISLSNPAAPPVEVVGVVADAVVDEFGEQPRPVVYVPHDRTAGELSIIAWTSLDPATALKALEAEVRSLDASLAVFDPMSMAQHVAERMDGERGLSRILALVGALALGLAAFGLYGVTAYAVTRRMREIGIRVALGASRRGILRLVLGDAARLVATGIVTGLVPGIAVTWLLSGMIFGVHPADPLAIGAATALLTCAAFAASYVPARRALRVDPVIALRAE